MSVSAVNGSGSQWYAQAQNQIQPAQPEMTNTAKLFDMSSSQLDQDLQSGTTLSSLASQDGVSSSSLISAIESDLQANAPQGAQQLSSSQLQGVATNIANGTAPAGGHHGGHHHHGMEMTDTGSDQGSGQSLASVLAADAYANSATQLESSTGATGQLSQYI